MPVKTLSLIKKTKLVAFVGRNLRSKIVFNRIQFTTNFFVVFINENVNKRIELDLSELIDQAKANNQQAFNAIFDMLWDDVYSFILKKTASHQVAEELSLVTFTKGFDRLHTYDVKYSFKTWLLTIAKNKHIDFMRRNKKNSEINIEVFEKNANSQLLNAMLSPEELLIKRQSLDALLMQIKSLNREYQTILKLRYFEDLTYKQMSVKLDLPINTVKVKLFRAKKMLSQTIENEKN